MHSNRQSTAETFTGAPGFMALRLWALMSREYSPGGGVQVDRGREVESSKERINEPVRPTGQDRTTVKQQLGGPSSPWRPLRETLSMYNQNIHAFENHPVFM